MSERVQLAQKALIAHEGAVLFVQKSTGDPYHPHKWELPGGRLEAGESLNDHLCREIAEEVGLVISPGRPVAIWDWILDREDDPVRVVAIARLCRLKGTTSANLEGNVEGDYLATAEWVEFDRVPDLDLIENAREPVLSALWAIFGADG